MVNKAKWLSVDGTVKKPYHLNYPFKHLIHDPYD